MEVLENVFVVTITNGYVGMESQYLASKYDDLDSLCRSDNIVDEFRSYVGAYRSAIDLIEDYTTEGYDINYEQAEDIIDEEVRDDIEYKVSKATLEDLELLPMLPMGYLHEGHELIDEYREYLIAEKRDENIDEILN